MLNEKLEAFALLARHAHGKAAAQLIIQATSSPSLYFFGELLDIPTLQALDKSQEMKPYYALLQLFAYGTISDYDSTRMPALTADQERKLRHLTLASLAKSHKKLTYTDLMEKLKVDHVQALEALVIDAIYRNVIRGQLDQKTQILQVDVAMGRDVSDTESQHLKRRLEQWISQCDKLLTHFDQRIEAIQKERVVRQESARQLQLEIEVARGKLKSATSESGTAMDVDELSGAGEDGNRQVQPVKSKHAVQ